MIEELQKELIQNQSLLPTNEEDAVKIKEMCDEQPLYIFDRIRQLLAELMFLTDVVEDH